MGIALQVVKIREFTGHSQAIYALCKNPSEDIFYSAGGDGMLVQWRSDEQDGILMARQSSAVYALAAHGSLLMSGTHSGIFSVYDPQALKLQSHLQVDSQPIYDIAVFREFILLATGGGNLMVLDHDFSLIKSIRLSGKSLRKITTMGDFLAVGGSEGIVWILGTDFNIVSRLEGHASSVFAIAYSGTSGILLTGGRDATLKLFRDGNLLTTINAHLLHVNCIALSDDESLYLTCSMDKTIKLWDAADNRLLKVIDYQKYGGHTSSVNKILWFDKKKFISCSDDRTLKCFEIQEK